MSKAATPIDDYVHLAVKMPLNFEPGADYQYSNFGYRVLAGDNFLSAEQKAKLFRPVRKHYACGWIVKKSGLDGRLYQTHLGANKGYFSKMMRIPEDDLVIIALGNVRMTEEIDEVLEQLFRLCRSLPY